MSHTLSGVLGFASNSGGVRAAATQRLQRASPESFLQLHLVEVVVSLVVEKKDSCLSSSCSTISKFRFLAGTPSRVKCKYSLHTSVGIFRCFHNFSGQRPRTWYRYFSAVHTGASFPATHNSPEVCVSLASCSPRYTFILSHCGFSHFQTGLYG